MYAASSCFRDSELRCNTVVCSASVLYVPEKSVLFTEINIAFLYKKKTSYKSVIFGSTKCLGQVCPVRFAEI